MKKLSIIALSALFIVNIFTNNIFSVGTFNVVINNNVEGDIGANISPQQVVLTFDDANVKFVHDNLPADTDISSWFNFPTGCIYTVKVVSCTDTALTVSFTGNIDNTASEEITPIDVTIPYVSTAHYVEYNSNPYIANIDDVINTGANYIINDPAFVIQYVQDYEISGIVGEPLTPQIVKAEITQSNGDCFVPSLDGVALPVVNGLTPTVIDIENDLIVTIEYTGTPINPSQDLIHTTIEKQYMDFQLMDRVVPDRSDVKFNIVPKSIPTPPVVVEEEEVVVVYTPPVTGID